LAVGPDGHVDARSVFVSSTYVDLKAFRSGVRDEVNGLGYTFIGMEDFLASPDTPRVVMLDHLARAQRYVGILGWRYGSRDVPTGWSYTQLEYETAVSWGIPIHMFIASNRVPINGGALDPDDGVARLHEFRAKVKQRHLIVEFDDVATLRARVRDSLIKYGGRD
jgi:hypothetical protein